MSRRVRISNNDFYNNTSVTATENSPTQEVLGARGYAIQIDLTDNGSAAGNISLEASIDGTTFTTLAGTAVTMSFTANAQTILYNIQDPAYSSVRVVTTVTAGNLDVVGLINIIEGGF